MRLSLLWLSGSFLALALLEVGCNSTSTDNNHHHDPVSDRRRGAEPTR